MKKVTERIDNDIEAWIELARIPEQSNLQVRNCVYVQRSLAGGRGFGGVFNHTFDYHGTTSKKSIGRHERWAIMLRGPVYNYIHSIVM